MLENLPTFQKLGTGETTHAIGLSVGATVHTAGHEQASAPDEEAKVLPPVMSLQCPLPTKLNTMPSGRGKLFKGSTSIFFRAVNEV